MTDLDALEYHVRRLGFPLVNSEEWTLDQKIRAYRICNAAPTLIAEHRALLAENAALRSALANSPGACVYCQLPANEMNRCASGFPGCGRADDMQGCPHFGSTEIPEDIQEQHVALLARVAELEEAIAGPEAWLNRWAAHGGSCKGSHRCTCGLARAQYDLSAALEPKP